MEMAEIVMNPVRQRIFQYFLLHKTGNTTNTRNIVALTDLGENQKLSNPMWAASGQVPSNQANTEYAAMLK